MSFDPIIEIVDFSYRILLITAPKSVNFLLSTPFCWYYINESIEPQYTVKAFTCLNLLE